MGDEQTLQVTDRVPLKAQDCKGCEPWHSTHVHVISLKSTKKCGFCYHNFHATHKCQTLCCDPLH